MELNDEDRRLVRELRSTLDMCTNTGTVAYALRIAAMVTDGLKRGKDVAFLDADGDPAARLSIPGLSRPK